MRTPEPPQGEARNTSSSALVIIGYGFRPPSFDESVGLARAIVSLNIVSMGWIIERMSIVYSITRLRIYSALVYHHCPLSGSHQFLIFRFWMLANTMTTDSIAQIASNSIVDFEAGVSSSGLPKVDLREAIIEQESSSRVL